MNREFNKQMKNAISGLLEHSPDDTLWQKIEAGLEFCVQLNKAVKQFPKHKADEKIWQNIDKKLDANKIKKLNPTIIRSLSIAADIAIVITIGFVFFSKGKETITIHTEASENWQKTSTLKTDSLSNQVFKFIENQCKMSPYLCKAPEFEKTNQQLIEVDTELEKVNRVIETLGDSPSLVITKTKLENLKAQLIKDIVKQVTS